jgi:hypothetical protein
MLQRARLGIGMLAVGVALALLPAATASASIEKSALCKAYSTEVNQQTKGAAGLAKEMESGNWPAIQKALLATFGKEASEEKLFAAYLNGASAKVKAAAAVTEKLIGQFKTVIQHSTNLTQFETGITSAEENPKFTAAEKVLDSYTKSLGCGAL